MNKRVIATILIGLLLAGVLVTPVAAAPPISVTVDGRQLQFDVPPTIIEGRTLVPLRGIFEALGAEISWDNNTRTVTGYKEGITVILPIGSRYPTVNGVPIEIDVAGTLLDGRTMVPARFIAESLNADVQWMQDTRTVVITSVTAGISKPAQTTDPVPETSKQTVSQKNALNSAKNYLSFTAFSRSGLIKQLEFEGYSTEDATYGVDNTGANWMEQAVKSAKNYLNVISFSASGLVTQLKFEGFTAEEARYGVENCGADWMEQAAKSAKNYLNIMPFSRSGLIQQLEFEGFTNAQAVFGVNEAGL